MRLSLLAFVSGAALFAPVSQGQAQVAMDASNMGLVIVGYDNRTCDSSTEGAIRYNSGQSEVQLCRLTECTSSLGNQCSDDTFYIGDVGADDIYATDQSFETQTSWNDGTGGNEQLTNVNSYTDGQSNTTTLVGLTSNTDSPYLAADYCDTLSAHGFSDWYLPASDELDLFWNGGTPIANIDTSGLWPSGWYWSSTEPPADVLDAMGRRFSDNVSTDNNKDRNFKVRCVRMSATQPSPGYAWVSWTE